MHFASDPSTNNNQSFIINQYEGSMQLSKVGYKGNLIKTSNSLYLNKYNLKGFTPSAEPIDVNFGVYNYIECRPEQIATFPLGTGTSTPQNGLIIAMDFYLYSNGPSSQTLFSIRDTSDSSKSMSGYYSDGFLNLWVYTASGVSLGGTLNGSLLAPVSQGMNKLS